MSDDEDYIDVDDHYDDYDDDDDEGNDDMDLGSDDDNEELVLRTRRENEQRQAAIAFWQQSGGQLQPDGIGGPLSEPTATATDDQRNVAEVVDDDTTRQRRVSCQFPDLCGSFMTARTHKVQTKS